MNLFEIYIFIFSKDNDSREFIDYKDRYKEIEHSVRPLSAKRSLDPRLHTIGFELHEEPLASQNVA